jgi:hypothetical protein
VSHLYRHEVCFIGPQDAAELIEAAEKAGFEFESGSTGRAEIVVGLKGERDEARGELKALRTRLADRRGEPSD